MANKLRGKTKKACESLTGAPLHLSISFAFVLLTSSARRNFGCTLALIVSTQYTPRFRLSAKANSDPDLENRLRAKADARAAEAERLRAKSEALQRTQSGFVPTVRRSPRKQRSKQRRFAKTRLA